MSRNYKISGFSDEIDASLDQQLQTVSALGMRHICLRAADGIGIADYSPATFRASVLPKLEAAHIQVSCLGSPIGKIGISDDAAYERQCQQLETLCEICKAVGCQYIRIFSFWMPHGENPDNYQQAVLTKLRRFVKIAEQYQITLLHENEKEIYGDTGRRCRALLDGVASNYLKAAFDFANFVQCGEDPTACWELLKKDVLDIHVKDAMCGSGENVLCGTGDGKIEEILTKAFSRDAFSGFLTLEPHLVLFGTLQNLEQKNAAEVIAKNKAATGAEAYAMQYHALQTVLNNIG